MTKREVERMLRKLQTLMRLDHWRLSIAWDEVCQPGAAATTWRTNKYDDAVLRFCEDWPGLSEDRMRVLLAHELGHLLTRDLEQAAWSTEEALGEAAPQFRAWFAHEIEGVVDRYAEIIAGLAA